MTNESDLAENSDYFSFALVEKNVTRVPELEKCMSRGSIYPINLAIRRVHSTFKVLYVFNA